MIIALILVVIIYIVEIVFFYLLIVACIKIVNSERLRLSAFLLDISDNLKGIWQFVFASIIVGVGIVIGYAIIIGIFGAIIIAIVIAHLPLVYIILGFMLIMVVAVVLVEYVLRFFLFPYVLVDKKMHAISALKTSFHLTKGKKVLEVLETVILLGSINFILFFILFSVLGFIAPFIVLRGSIPNEILIDISLFVMPFNILVYIYLYKALDK